MLLRSFVAWLAVLVIAGCAAVPAVPLSATAEAREILAPTGSLRVNVEDPTGVGEVLAGELGRRLRVPVVFAKDGDIVLARAAGERGLLYSPPYLENYAIGIASERSRALPFLTDFVGEAVERGVVRDAIQREGSRGRM